jgi:hypothetical protein
VRRNRLRGLGEFIPGIFPGLEARALEHLLPIIGFAFGQNVILAFIPRRLVSDAVKRRKSGDGLLNAFRNVPRRLSATLIISGILLFRLPAVASAGFGRITVTSGGVLAVKILGCFIAVVVIFTHHPGGNLQGIAPAVGERTTVSLRIGFWGGHEQMRFLVFLGFEMDNARDLVNIIRFACARVCDNQRPCLRNMGRHAS